MLCHSWPDLLYSENREKWFLQLTCATNPGEVKEFEYGERNDKEIFLQGKVLSVETIYEESTKITYYTIKLETEGKDELHQFEIYSAKLLDKTLDGSLIVPGTTVIAKGYLSTNMAYKSQAK